MVYYNRPALVQIIVCCLFGNRRLSEPTMTCQLGRLEQTSVKFESKYEDFHSRKSISKCRVQNIANCIAALVCQYAWCASRENMYHAGRTVNHFLKKRIPGTSTEPIFWQWWCTMYSIASNIPLRFVICHNTRKQTTIPVHVSGTWCQKQISKVWVKITSHIKLWDNIRFPPFTDASADANKG